MTSRQYFKVSKGKNLAPFLVNIPHASKHIPTDFRKKISLTVKKLNKELVSMTDTFTDELFSGVKSVYGVMLINCVSRLVADPERFCDDKKEVMASKGMGVIYSKTSDGSDLRKAVSKADRARIVDQYYKPYHAQLAKETEIILAKFNKCLIIDGHSFPSRPLPYELNQSVKRPDICIGTDPYHTSRFLQEFCMNYWLQANFPVRLNYPYAGSLVPMKYYKKDERVQSVMIEIRRGLYMNESSGKKNNGFARMKKVVNDFFHNLQGAFKL